MKEIQEIPRVLTSGYVEKLVSPGEYRELELKGFFVQVSPKGTKTYYVKNSVKGGRSSVSVKIGRHGQLTTMEARKRARAILLQMSEGVDPNREKAVVRKKLIEEEQRQAAHRIKEICLKDVLNNYLADRSLKPNTAVGYRQLAHHCFGDWLTEPITLITKDMVEQKFRSLSVNSKSQANKAIRVLRALFNYADAKYEFEGRSIVPENPTKRLKQLRAWHRISQRESVIRDHQLKDWYAAVVSLENHTVRDYLILLLFTGLRREEAASLLWKNVDFRGKTLTVTNTKNHRDHMLPMADFVYDLLFRRRNRLLASGGYGEYVFPGSGRTQHLQEPRKPILKVREMSGVEFTSHDLRRTVSTIADRIGIDKFTVGRILNHKSIGVTDGYIISDAARLIEPVKLIAEHIEAQLEILHKESEASPSPSSAPSVIAIG